MATGITPGRKTVVTIDPPDVYVQEKSIFKEKVLEGIGDVKIHRNFAQTPSGTFSDPGYNVTLEPGQGWTLASQIEAGEYGFETNGFDAGNIPLTLHSSILQRTAYRDNTDLPGVTLGTNQQSSGFTMNQKEVAASGTFNAELSADRAAYPPPTMDEIQPLMRIAVGTAHLSPTDKITYNFLLHDGSSRLSNTSAINRLYFSSLAGSTASDGAAVGTGQYCLTTYGAQRCFLHERLVNAGTYTWALRKIFYREVPRNGFHGIVIFSDAVKLADGSYRGTKIFFRFVDSNSNSILSSVVAGLQVQAIEALGGGDLHTYTVPNSAKYQPQPDNLRIDERRDVRSSWYVQKSLYYRTGTIRTYTVDVGYPTSSTEPLYIEWFGSRPAGTTVAIACYDAETGAALTASGSEYHYTVHGVKGFDPTSGRTADTSTRKYTRSKFFAVITISTPDGLATPNIRRVRFWRNPIGKTHSPTPIVVRTVDSVSITGQDSDPSHETATIRVHDLRGELSALQSRAGMPIRVEIQYDPLDATKLSTIFTGYVVKAKRVVKGGTPGKAYPVDNWATYDIICTGEWQRLYQAQTKQRWNFTEDAGAAIGDAKLTWKITDIVKALILDEYGSTDNMIIPDIDVRLFPSGETDQLLTLEPHTPVFPVLMTLVMQYLGGWIDWDANASQSVSPTKMGAWRLHIPPRPNGSGLYRCLASFKQKTNNAGGGVRLNYADTYQATETGIDGQTLKTIWVRKGSLSSHVIPPEGNGVMVTGTGLATGIFSKSSNDGDKMLTQTCVNYASAKFFDGQPSTDAFGNPLPNPNSPDYTNGRPVWIYIGDPSFQSQQAVDFYCRRVYDLACHSQRRINFEAACLLVTDVNDPYQRRPRPLKYGDPVYYAGVAFFTANCSIDYHASGGGTRKMMATYELFSPADIADGAKTLGVLVT